jgi:hypothetical protein
MSTEVQLEGGTYEVLRQRLEGRGAELRERLGALNTRRQEVFGSVQTSLITTERVSTENNCVARDVAPIGGNKFLFGYNVRMGLKSETNLEDVFAVHEYLPAEHRFQALTLECLRAENSFETEFKQLFKYYKNTTFARFAIIGPALFIVFQVGATENDVKTFKFALNEKEGTIAYVGNRFDHEYVFPPQHEFEWKRSSRDAHRTGKHPHVSIQDRVFVETIGGDLTIKVEDNTEDGQGIYSEPVDHKDQTLDDAEIHFAALEHLILLKIKPYQEKNYRYFIYNEKLKEVRRLDEIAVACVLLPNSQGIIFANGYYLQSGECKVFDTGLVDMKFSERRASPNGEDFLYVFYNRATGTYVLGPYNIIQQKVENPIICSGYALFPSGELAFFRADEEPARHHAIQIWQTPFTSPNYVPPVKTDSLLYKIGNAALVGAMAECQEILNLLNRGETYGGLYIELAKRTQAVLDAYFWLDKPEAGGLRETLLELNATAGAAISEFEKVTRIRKSTADEIARVRKAVEDAFMALAADRMETIQAYVEHLAKFRQLRGQVITLKDLRYADLPLIEGLEKRLVEQTESLSQRLVEYLLQATALDPYKARVAEHQAAVEKLTKVTEAEVLETEVAETGRQLELLMEIIGNLKIADATQATAILDAITAIYSPLNQVKGALKARKKELMSVEGAAQFASQVRLLGQSVLSYLDLCDTPERCDEYLGKVMVTVEELEGKFADFEEYVATLVEKREEFYNAFETRKLQLMEARQKRSGGLAQAADRILKSLANRVQSFKTIEEINGYFAGDLMVDKLRDTVKQLLDLNESVRADDIQTRLKTLQENAVRQLKDRQELFVDGQNIIQFGKHKFTVNTQALELTVVPRDGGMTYHLTGTQFFEPITDEEFLATKPVWDLEAPSESPGVYRGEYLAYKLLRDIEDRGELEAAAKFTPEERLARVQAFSAPRYEEAYVKGVHDQDAAQLLGPLLELHASLGNLRFPANARALGILAWLDHARGFEGVPPLRLKLKSFADSQRLFGGDLRHPGYLAQLQGLTRSFAVSSGLFTEDLAAQAADYLFAELQGEDPVLTFALSREGAQLADALLARLREVGRLEAFREGRDKLAIDDLAGRYQLCLDWVSGFARGRSRGDEAAYAPEAACVVLLENPARWRHLEVGASAALSKLAGSHPTLPTDGYVLEYHDFMERLRRHETEVVPVYQAYVAFKKRLIENKRVAMRLEEFQTRVLTSFVRNQLIDETYLPLIGDNLAKQIGSAGENKRTDRMGLLLVISPPGYGKTTLMEYVANRLGLVFMKINGPALGHEVTSLDPSQAPNAGAREEIAKLNLALEMGDNVMLYLDDIQHTNPEFLQKFISLCDGQRRIEGVYNGRPRTYDLRGRKVAVVMAGNPYTESGTKFQIPDMLSNRADTYNLGDILSGHEGAFQNSYLENAVTSNQVLAKLAVRSAKDIRTLIKIAETGNREGLDLEGSFSSDELEEMLNVMRKMIAVRKVILRVNQEYIASAAQADAYRTEPPFKLQGSYRNMGRLAEKLVPLMNEAELQSLIRDHYQNESQTLTSGAEANLLKFREITGMMSPADTERWAEIKKTFQRGQLMSGADGTDPVNKVVAQLSTFREGLEGIQSTLAKAASAPAAKPNNSEFEDALKGLLALLQPAGRHVVQVFRPEDPKEFQETAVSQDTLEKIWELVKTDQERRLERLDPTPEEAPAPLPPSPPPVKLDEEMPEHFAAEEKPKPGPITPKRGKGQG